MRLNKPKKKKQKQKKTKQKSNNYCIINYSTSNIAIFLFVTQYSKIVKYIKVNQTDKYSLNIHGFQIGDNYALMT